MYKPKNLYKMRKVYTFILSLLLMGQLFAGGIVTNSNQSAQYLRMLARSASGEIDAVYYNPAGIMRMDNGFHMYIGNQSLFQTRTITTSGTLFPMNMDVHEGAVNAYLYPNLYAVYKMDKLAISLGFGPNGGGGSAEFKDGLPMFERPIAAIPGGLTTAGIPTSMYSMDAYFKGSSVFYGTQLNVAYEINDFVSVAAGVRMINASNKYEGYLRNIMINPDLSTHALSAFLPQYTGDMASAPEFFSDMSTALTGAAGMAYAGATSAYGAGAGLQPLIDASIPDLETALAANAIDQATYDQLTGGLGGNYVAGMGLATLQATYNGMGDQYTAAGDEYTQNAAVNAANAQATGDIEVDAKQSGLAFTPIISVNITPIENLNIAVKYEMNTNLELTNDTKIDGSGLFVHDSTFRSDIPAILALGVEYGISDNLRAQVSYVTYFDKGADWGGKEKYIDKNLFELAFGIEYNVNEKLLVSGGYSLGQAGPMDEYQSELSYTNSSHTIGLGAQYKATDKLTLDVGVMNTIYVDHEVDYIDASAGYPYTTTYGKKTIGFGIGAAYKF